MWLLIKVYVPTFFLLLIVIATQQFSGLPLGWFTKDPSAITGTPPYLGILSTLGILGWTIGTSIALFAATISYTVTPLRSLLIGFGLFTALLGIDDAFLLHEEVAPQLLFLPEEILFAGYAGAVLVLLALHRDAIRSTRWELFIAATFFFAVSVGIDVFNEKGEYLAFCEDVAKFTGITSWTGWLVHTSFQTIERRSPSSSSQMSSTSASG